MESRAHENEGVCDEGARQKAKQAKHCQADPEKTGMFPENLPNKSMVVLKCLSGARQKSLVLMTVGPGGKATRNCGGTKAMCLLVARDAPT